MLRNFDKQITLIDGTLVVDSDRRDAEGNLKPMLQKDCIVNALVMSRDADAGLSGDERLRRYRLAEKVQDGGDIDLTVDDIAHIKSAIEKTATTLIYGQIVDALDNDLEKKEEE